MGKVLPVTEPTRRSLTIPGRLAARIETIAKQRHVTTNRVILDMIEDGIAVYDKRRCAFLELTEQFQKSTDPAETERLRERLIQMTFGG
jgi:hypothetical protein